MNDQANPIIYNVNKSSVNRISNPFPIYERIVKISFHHKFIKTNLLAEENRRRQTSWSFVIGPYYTVQYRCGWLLFPRKNLAARNDTKKGYFNRIINVRMQRDRLWSVFFFTLLLVSRYTTLTYHARYLEHISSGRIARILFHQKRIHNVTDQLNLQKNCVTVNANC